MATGADIGKQPLSAGFPVKKKVFDAKKFHPSARLNGGTVIYTYWTNFRRDRPKDFEVLTTNPKNPGYWEFQSNLSPDDFDYVLSVNQQRTFLYGIVDHYRDPED